MRCIKVSRNFEIQTDPLIPFRRSDFMVINKRKKKKKKKLPWNGFCHFDLSQSENKRKRKDKLIIGLCQRSEKAKDHEGDGDTSCN